MIRTLLVAAFAAAGAALPDPASAQSGPPESDPRYSYNRVDDGYLRLDTRTGQVSLCKREGSGWACRLTPDERTALEGEIERLQRENAQLKRALLDRGLALPGGARGGEPDASPPRPRQDLTPPGRPPSENEIDRTLTFIEKIWRRLVEMMMNLQRDLKKSSLAGDGVAPS